MRRKIFVITVVLCLLLMCSVVCAAEFERGYYVTVAESADIDGEKYINTYTWDRSFRDEGDCMPCLRIDDCNDGYVYGSLKLSDYSRTAVIYRKDLNSDNAFFIDTKNLSQYEEIDKEELGYDTEYRIKIIPTGNGEAKMFVNISGPRRKGDGTYDRKIKSEFEYVLKLADSETVKFYELETRVGALTHIPKVTFSGGSGTVDDPYLVSTPEQLRATGIGKTGSYYALANDIDLAAYENWQPIDNRSSFYLDGRGFSIKHMNITEFTQPYKSEDEDDSYYSYYLRKFPSAGLYNILLNGEVKNLVIEDSRIWFEDDSKLPENEHLNIGMLAGYSSATNIENVHVSGSIRMYLNEKRVNNVGGIFGKIENPLVAPEMGSSERKSSYIRNCSVYVNMDLNGKYAFCTGGVCGESSCTDVNNCVNYSYIKAPCGIVGGIVANNGGSEAGSAGFITKCVNYGDIDVIQNRFAVYGFMDKTFLCNTSVGGVTGYNHGGSVGGCVNKGEIIYYCNANQAPETNDAHILDVAVGGVVGTGNASMYLDYAYYTGDSAESSNCFNLGNVKATYEGDNSVDTNINCGRVYGKKQNAYSPSSDFAMSSASGNYSLNIGNERYTDSDTLIIGIKEMNNKVKALFPKFEF